MFTVNLLLFGPTYIFPKNLNNSNLINVSMHQNCHTGMFSVVKICRKMGTPANFDTSHQTLETSI